MLQVPTPAADEGQMCNTIIAGYSNTKAMPMPPAHPNAPDVTMALEQLICPR